MTNHDLMELIDKIGEVYKPMILKGSRNYLEVSVGEQARMLGYTEIEERHKDTCLIVPLKASQKGMKVRIDGRTFVNYAEHASGIAFPGYLAREAGRSFKRYTPNDSMICNFT